MDTGERPFCWDELLDKGDEAWFNGDLTAAENSYKTALFFALQERLFVHAPTADVLSRLGQIYAEQDRCDQAEKMFRLALLVYQNVAAPDSIEITETLRLISTICSRQKKTVQAEEYGRRADNEIDCMRDKLEKLFKT